MSSYFLLSSVHTAFYFTTIKVIKVDALLEKTKICVRVPAPIMPCRPLSFLATHHPIRPLFLSSPWGRRLSGDQNGEMGMETESERNGTTSMKHAPEDPTRIKFKGLTGVKNHITATTHCS